MTPGRAAGAALNLVPLTLYVTYYFGMLFWDANKEHTLTGVPTPRISLAATEKLIQTVLMYC